MAGFLTKEHVPFDGINPLSWTNPSISVDEELQPMKIKKIAQNLSLWLKQH